MSERRALLFHPPLFALHPPLALYAANVSLIPFSDTVVPMLVSILATCALWVALRWPLKDFGRAGAAASILAYGFFLFGDWEKQVANWDLFREFIRPVEMHRIVFALILICMTVLMSWKWRFARTISTFMNVMGLAMVAFAVLGIVQSRLAIGGELAKIEKRLGTTRRSGSAIGLPDVYYIILDGYGRADVLKRYYGFDNTPFISQLEKRGFYVSADARPNYVQTELSLASSLNLDFIQNLTKPQLKASDSRGVLDGLIDRNRFAGKLKELGYRYVAVGSGFPALRFASADNSFSRDFGTSLYLEALIEKTPLTDTSNQPESMFTVRYDMLVGAFQTLEVLAKPSLQPKFVLAHILAPHPPFVLAPDGSFSRPRRHFTYADGSHYMEMVGNEDTYRSGYTGQVQAVDTKLLHLIDTILAKSTRRPIIILQGDHGPKMHLSQDTLAKTDMGEVGGILAAYFVPDTARKKLQGTLTPINAMGTILGSITGEDFQAVPNATFYSTWDKPEAFDDVTADLDRVAKERGLITRATLQTPTAGQSH